MAALALTARALLRRGWRGVVVLAVLIGLAGGAVLAAWAGARRTESALPRLIHATRAADVEVAPSVDITTAGFRNVGDVGTLPQVARSKASLVFGVLPWAGHPPQEADYGRVGLAPVSSGPAGDFDRPRVVAGRMPAAGAVDEIAVNEGEFTDLRDNLHAKVGDRVNLAWFNYKQLVELYAGGQNPKPEQIAPAFHPFRARLVGVVRRVVDVTGHDPEALVLFSPAFATAHHSDASSSQAAVLLRNGGQLRAFEEGARARHPADALRFIAASDQVRVFSSGTSPYADAFRLFAVVAAVASLLVIGQALARQAYAGSSDAATLRALGLPRRDLVLAVAARGAIAAVGGTVFALVLAFAVSQRFPAGDARRAEPHPGVHADWFVFGIAGAVIVVTLLAVVALVSWRAVGSAVRAAEPQPAARASLARSLPPANSAAIGVRHALTRSHGGAARGSTVLALTIAIATLAAALGFAAGLDRLVGHPREWGWNWDAAYETYETGLASTTAAAMQRRPEITALTVGTRGNLATPLRSVPALGLDVRRGGAVPQFAAGRMPESDDEIALGARTMRALGTSLGGTISVRDPAGRAMPLRVVGRVVVPPSLGLGTQQRIGEGAVLTAKGLARFDAAKPSFALVDLRDASSQAQKKLSSTLADTGDFYTAERPVEIASYAAVRSTPRVLALLLALLGVGVLGHSLVTSVRARRRELAVLKALGFVRRQVVSTVAAEATTLVAVAAVVGVLAGMLVNRVVWQRFTDALGVATTSVVPVAALALFVVAVLVIANLIALLPAWRAARRSPSTVLRSE